MRRHNVRLSAWPGFAMPDVTGAIEGAVEGPTVERELDAVYWDTPDLRLARRGVTVRRRRGDGQQWWTVDLPATPYSGSHSDTERAGTSRRDEHDFAGPDGRPPDAVTLLVGGWVRSSTLGAVAHLRTFRRSRTLLESDREPLAQIDDDEVSVLDGDRISARFREVEVELIDRERPEVLEAIATRLTDAGAGPVDPVPKLVRAVGPRALAPPELSAASPGVKSTAAEALRAQIAANVARIIDSHAVIVIGDDPEGVHQCRVGARRLRSLLRVFGAHLDSKVTEQLGGELAWLTGQLGTARDLDVMASRLRAHVAELDRSVDIEAASGVLSLLEQDRARAQTIAAAAVDSERYTILLDSLVAFATDPTWSSTRFPGRSSSALYPQLRTAQHALIRRGTKAQRKPTDRRLHRVRVSAKRARYGVDVVVPVVGPRARATSKALASLQRGLGDQHDAVTARDWLRTAGPRLDGGTAFAAGLLMGIEERYAERGRNEWRSAWERVSAKKTWTWLS